MNLLKIKFSNKRKMLIAQIKS